MAFKLTTLSHRIRKHDARQKFLLGLSFEKADLAIKHGTYISSDMALEICDFVLKSLADDASKEHFFYKKGKAAFDSKSFIEASRTKNKAKPQNNLQNEKERYHNLVRLGGDILRSGLAEHPKATILGGFFHYAKIKGNS